MYSILCKPDDIDDDRLISASYEDPSNIFPKVKPYARYTLLLLTILNLFNYCDRYIPSTTKEMMKEEWNLTDAETGYAVLVFLLTYMVFGPLFGTLVDSGIPRKWILGVGIVGWSMASASAFWTTNLATFLVTRACVGIGESSFSVIAPSLISDFYPESKRNSALAIFYVSMPLGGAIGFGIGGLLTEYLGWQYAYLITGIPGLILALLLIPIKDPGIGALDKMSQQGVFMKKSWPETFKKFWDSNLYITVVIGATLQAFGIGAMADWLPAFYTRSFPDIPPSDSFLVVGGITVIGGFCGIILGGVSAEYCGRMRIPHPYAFTPTVCLYISTIFMIASLGYKNIYSTSFLFALAQIFYFATIAPTSTLVANLMDGPYRARAYGFQLLVSHALGDAISPTLVGLVSDKFHNLDLAITLVPFSVLLSGIVFLLGWIQAFKTSPPIRTRDDETDSGFRD